MKKFLGIVLLLVVAMVFIGCPQPGGTTDPVNPTKVNAVEPVFKSDLSEDMQTYAHGETTPLSATASVTDGGTISYQWYSNDEANTETPTMLDGATKASFSPPTATSGIFYYYAVATNTIEDNEDGGTKTASITSKVATIAVSNAESDFDFNEDTGEIWRYSGTSNVVIIPSTIGGVAVTKIGNTSFYRKDTITSIRIPDTVTAIGDGAFHDCSSLVSINLPAGIESIAKQTFMNCTSLESITIPESVTVIGNNAFDNCTSLVNVNLPSGLTTIGIGAFRDCKIESITIPGSVTAIGNYAFSSRHLTSVVILEGLTEIGNNAFADCSSLISVSLPSSLETIGGWAFEDCLYLESLTVQAVVPPTAYSESFTNTPALEHIYVPSGSVDAYKAATTWSGYSAKIQAIP